MPISSNQHTDPSDDCAILASLKQVMQLESDALLNAMQHLNESAVAAVELIRKCDGKLVVTGVGKTGCIARKASATFSSTGTPSMFLHAAEAAHGDLGMVSKKDVVLALSNSGASNEILNLLPYLQRFEIPLIAITGNPSSELAKRSQITIPIETPNEADYNGLAPTSSSTVAMAICDALAITIAKVRGFTPNDFAMFHPAGVLGRKLLVSTNSIMHHGDDLPVATADLRLRDAIGVISHKQLGALIVTQDSKVIGILTDGDIRRALQSNDNPLPMPIGEFMTQDPVLLQRDTLAAEALRIMQTHSISVLPVVDKNCQLAGVLHLHDLIKAGLV